MYGVAKHAAFGDPLKTGHQPEEPGSRTLNDRQESGVVFSGKTDAGNHDNKYGMGRLWLAVHRNWRSASDPSDRERGSTCNVDTARNQKHCNPVTRRRPFAEDRN